MIQRLLLFVLTTSVFVACSQIPSDTLSETTTEDTIVQEFNPNGMTVKARYRVPDGFQRVPADSNSFAYYLRNLPLKSADAEVTYYDGEKKPKGHVYKSVVDLPIGRRNLHQCADAVMRFRAEYLWSTGQHNNIHFNFTNGFRVDYSKWLAGNRMVVSGNKTYWTPGTARQNNYQTFWEYMELIFNYAGTLSLDRELPKRDFSEMQIGDVLIKGGSPGHAVIVVDMCKNISTGEKCYMLAQSYMPAQETQILLNPMTPETSWYSLQETGNIRTPEWTFNSDNLKHF